MRQSISGIGQEKLDPSHERVEQARSFRVDIVDKSVECLFVSLDEIDEGLYCT